MTTPRQQNIVDEVITELVRHSVGEEVMKGLENSAEGEEEFERAKMMAPTRPHPLAPEKPPANGRTA